MKEIDMIQRLIPEGILKYLDRSDPDIVLSYVSISKFRHEILKNSDLFENSQGARIFSSSDFSENFLHNTELEKINSFSSLKKQVEWMAGRYALKFAVKDITGRGLDPDKIHASYRKEGAPFIADMPEVPISISHSGEYACAACAKDPVKSLGIDIEMIRELDLPPFMKLVFSSREFQELGSPDITEVIRRFTVKEAFLKVIGKGFNEALKAVEELEGVVYYKGERCSDLEVDSFACATGYIVSIAKII